MRSGFIRRYKGRYNMRAGMRNLQGTPVVGKIQPEQARWEKQL